MIHCHLQVCRYSKPSSALEAVDQLTPAPTSQHKVALATNNLPCPNI
jgi:hypothetical protein